MTSGPPKDTPALAGPTDALALRLEELVGSERFVRGAAAGAAIHGMHAPLEVRPADAGQLSDILAVAHAESLGTCVVGGGTKLCWGNRPGRLDLMVDTRDLRGFSQIDADNLSLSVRAGTSVAEVQAEARATGRVLPLDPYQPGRATVGGVVATGDQGARGAGYGGLRDVVLGLSAVLADGSPVKFGGRTMKNVAGYDMTKLFIGSFGVLGVITEVTFRLLPRYETQALMILPLQSLDQGREIATGILDSYLQPLALEVVSSGYLARAIASGSAGPVGGIDGISSMVPRDGPVMLAGFAGQRAAVDRSVGEVRERYCAEPFAVLEGAEAESLYEVLADAGADAGTGEQAEAASTTGERKRPVQARATVPLSRAWGLAQSALSKAGARDLALESRIGVYRGTVDLLVGGGAGLRPEVESAILNDLRREAEATEGALTIRDGLTRLTPDFDAWGRPSSSVVIMKRIKERFDPHGILNPGRFVGGI